MRETRSSHSTIGATAISVAGESDPLETEQRSDRPRLSPVARPALESPGRPRSAFRSWPEIRERLRAAKRWAFFLDFDGTLVNLRQRPGDVRMPRSAKLVLKRLASHPNVRVAIVSGRTLRNVRALIAVNGLSYFGVHGGEREGKPVALAVKSRRALEAAKRSARHDLGGVRGIWIEDKGLSFAVHYRDAGSAAAASAGAALSSFAEASGNTLHVLHGSYVWEVLPREIPGKFTAVGDVLGRTRHGTAVVYVGNDGTDEVAFAHLPGGITVRVGREPRTCARYSVRNPAEVLRLLARMEKELP
jgi:trehalose 6-phosphate phosphatase